MQINVKLNIGPLASPKPNPPKPGEGLVQADQARFGSTESINNALSQSLEVRPDKVKLAKELIADSNYPPRETIRKIADLLAINFASEGD